MYWPELVGALDAWVLGPYLRCWRAGREQLWEVKIWLLEWAKRVVVLVLLQSATSSSLMYNKEMCHCFMIHEWLALQLVL